jgi:hypothetical protein
MVQMRAYHDSELTTRSAGMASRHSLSPSFHRPRTSETGSIFREEVWPPPAEFVDPFLTSVKRNQEVDLGRIVDDVMGPVMGPRSGHTPSSSFSSGQEAGHRNTESEASYVGLLDEFGARRQSLASSSSAYSDPYDPPDESSGTVYDPLQPGAAHAAQESGHNPIMIAPGAYSLRAVTAGGPSVAKGLAAYKPKKPSPLARAISSASHNMGDTTRLWLDRKVRKRTDEGASGSHGAGADVDGRTDMAC